MNPAVYAFFELNKMLANTTSIMATNNTQTSNRDSETAWWALGIQIASIAMGLCAGVVLTMACRGNSSLRQIQMNQAGQGKTQGTKITLDASNEVEMGSFDKLIQEKSKGEKSTEDKPTADDFKVRTGYLQTGHYSALGVYR